MVLLPLIFTISLAAHGRPDNFQQCATEWRQPLSALKRSLSGAAKVASTEMAHLVGLPC